MEKKAEELKRRIKEVGKDSGPGKKFARELVETNKTVRDLNKHVLEADRVLNNLSTAKPGELRATLSALNQQLQFSNIERGSEKWKRIQENIRRVKEEIRNVAAESTVAESRMSRLSNGFNRYFGTVTSGIAAITGITLSVRRAVDDFARLEESEADVMKYTGMAGEKVKELGEAFKKWDTRTARTELNALAADAGRLGKKSKKDLLDFAEAGNIIKIALGEDLGEGAIKSIGKLSMMFGNADKMGLKEAMLATGSAINEVAQNSSAAEPYLVEFTNRLAGVGNQAKMSISQIIGLGSVLDQNAQQVEMSSTALSGLIMKLYKEPAKFAKIAGLEVKSFTELLRKDANGALLTLLETLSKKGGMADLAPVFDEMKLDGARAASVLSVLAGNIEQIRKEQETATRAFNEGTSAVNEYGVKNNTLQAQIDRAKNKFQELVYELGQRLAPHMSIFISTGGSMVKIISAITNFLINYGRQILAVAATIAAYTVAVKAQNALLVINNTLSEISRVNKMREAILTRQNAAAQLIFNDTVQKRNFLVKASAVITSLFSAATSLLTGNTKKAAAAMQTLNAITKLNPVGLAVAAVTALAAGIFLLTRRTSEYIDKAKALTGITNEANKSIYREKTELELLFSVAKNEMVSKEERLKAIKKLNEIAPEYLGNISLENINTQAAATAVKAYTDELIKNAKAKAVADKITELEGKRLDNLNKIAKLEEKMIKGVPMQISAL